METFFKRWFWTVNVAVVALAGVLAARTVTAFAAARLAEPPAITTPADKPQVRNPVRTFAATVNEKALAAVFGMTVAEEVPTATPVEPQVPAGSEVPTSLNATLVATVEADPREYSVAVITDNASRETGVYGVGDTLMGSAEVVSVERRRVLVRNNGRTEVLEMDAEEGGKPQVASAAPSITPVHRNDDGANGEGIKKVSENEYVVSREEIDKTLSNLNSIATQARIVPAFKNGVAQGFKLFSIRPGSIYAKIGIQNGDVIKRINGYEINSPDKALEIYQKLQTASRVDVELERRGQTLKKSYSID